MRRPSISVNIAAPPAKVWDVLADVERWHEWTPSITSIQKLDAGPLAVGSCALVRQPKLPPATWKVTELEIGRYFIWETSSHGMKIVANHLIEATSEGSRATLSLEYSGLIGGIMAWLAKGLTATYLNFEANGLKKRSEEETR